MNICLYIKVFLWKSYINGVFLGSLGIKYFILLSLKLEPNRYESCHFQMSHLL